MKILFTSSIFKRHLAAVIIAVCMAMVAQPALATTIQLNFLYIHGVESDTSSKNSAANALQDLQSSVNSALVAKIQAYQTAHPGVTIVTNSARVNLYTATPSPYHPSNSTGPLTMDDWTVGAPGCTTTKQGDPCTTAYEWRWRLANQIKTVFGSSAKNIILVGHSTGARTAMEVAANMGVNGVGTTDWGVQSMIAGVVTVHGMLDALNPSKYNVVGGASFDSTCKNSNLILQIFGGTAPGDGWCEYAGDVGGFPSADWVAANKYALMMNSYASCSPALWTGWSDGRLPFDAQASTKAIGINMTAAPNTTYRPAYGVFYGQFCHTAISDGNDANHSAAVSAASNQIINWVFTSAPRVASSGSITTPQEAYNKTYTSSTLGGSCPSGTIDGSIRVTGVCHHPGYFDGDDHIVATSEVAITDGTTCNGSFKWTQKHDSNNTHNADFWWQTYDLPAAGALIGTLN